MGNRKLSDRNTPPVIVISTKGVARTEKSIRRRRRIVRFLHSLTLGRNDKCKIRYTTKRYAAAGLRPPPHKNFAQNINIVYKRTFLMYTF